MTERVFGRVLKGTIELDSPIPSLEGKRVILTVELEDDVVARALQQAPPDDRPYSDKERADVAAAKQEGPYLTTAELRQRLANAAK